MWAGGFFFLNSLIQKFEWWVLKITWVPYNLSANYSECFLLQRKQRKPLTVILVMYMGDQNNLTEKSLVNN